MKRNDHFIVPAAQFELDPASMEHLTEYRFNTKRAVHKFCKVCGVQSFYHPRSNPDGVAVTVACVAGGTLRSIERRYFDGAHWEQQFAASDITSFSKPAAAADAGAAASGEGQTS